MLEELSRLVSEVPAKDELAHAKRNLTGNHAIGQQRNTGHAAHMALDALYGSGPDANQRYTAAIEAVGREDILRVAKQAFVASNRTVGKIVTEEDATQ